MKDGFFHLVLLQSLSTVLSLNITILHTNDVHARFESFNAMSRNCSQSDVASGQCFGGAARRFTAVKNIRDSYRNVLLLDGGDQFQGTVWYTSLKWHPIAKYMNLMNYTAGAFGNHEFDDGLELLEPYVKELSFPIVNSNIEATKESAKSFERTFVKSHQVTVEGQIIGIVGYTTPETVDLSRPGTNIKFNNEIVSLRKSVKELQSKGINKIIAIGHSGILTDREICQEVPGVDVVVGGHTNTFLYTGDQPSTEDPEGPYPEVYTTFGDNCLVVQDYAFGKYLGFLQLVIDDSTGKITAWSGNPILINSTVYEEDSEMSSLLKPYKTALERMQKDVIGFTASALDGRTAKCRLEECNLGNLVTDSLLYHYVENYIGLPKSHDNVQKYSNHSNNSMANLKSWTNVAIAILNGGGIREFQADSMSNLTRGDLYTFMPFANTVELIQIKGEHLLKAFEHSAKDYNTLERHGKFLQVSGVKIVYDLRMPNGKRVRSVLLKCSECPFPVYEPLEKGKLYNIVTSSYLKNGGDGYRMIKDNVIRSDSAEILDVDVVLNYIRKFQPIYIGLENRISFSTEISYQAMCNRCDSFSLNYLITLFVFAFVL